MILDGFKSKNVIRQFHKSLNNPLKLKDEDSSKIETVLLFIDDEVDQKVIALLSDNLEVSVSNIHFFIFKNKVDKNEVCENCITKKDFGLFGKLSNDSLKEKLGKPFDLLVNLTQNNEFSSNLIAGSNASFKVGLLDDFAKACDLIIDVKIDDLKGFNQELKKYLKILNKL